MYHTVGYSAVKSTDTCHSMNYENMLSEKSDTEDYSLSDFLHIKLHNKGSGSRGPAEVAVLPLLWEAAAV